jgi:hypothetical protein
VVDQGKFVKRSFAHAVAIGDILVLFHHGPVDIRKPVTSILVGSDTTIDNFFVKGATCKNVISNQY